MLQILTDLEFLLVAQSVTVFTSLSLSSLRTTSLSLSHTLTRAETTWWLLYKLFLLPITIDNCISSHALISKSNTKERIQRTQSNTSYWHSNPPHLSKVSSFLFSDSLGFIPNPFDGISSSFRFMPTSLSTKCVNEDTISCQFV